MRKTCFLITLLICCFTLTAQDCISLGCADSYTVNTDGTQPDQASGPEWGCYNGYPRKQTFWQYFYSPSGGNYTQSFSSPADLDWIVFDMGTSLPSFSCPVNPILWTQVGCDISYNPGGPTGPGVESTVGTIAGHYYAVALILWEPLTLTFTFGTPQLGGSNLSAANCLLVLPAKLISFTAAPDGNNVLLKWMVNEELNVDRYEIEMSIAGTDFSTIGSIKANNKKSYSFLHTGPATAGILYYRLKTVDIDGKISYSGIIRIQVKDSKGLLVITNPVTNNLNITGLKGKGKIRIADLTGKVILEKPVQSQALSINVSFIHAGMYLLQYADGNNIETMKILKQ